MTDSEKELVKRLRLRREDKYCGHGEWTDVDDVDCYAAADAIERLSAQVESLTKDREILTLDLIDRAKEIEALAKERDEARAERDKANDPGPLLPHIRRILDDESAYIARPSAHVDMRIGIAAMMLADERASAELKSRTEAAEAEVARLREALTKIADKAVQKPSVTLGDVFDALTEIYVLARAALEGGK